MGPSENIQVKADTKRRKKKIAHGNERNLFNTPYLAWGALGGF
jgi:hypothetical protein